jgi:hypothetical protein
MVRHLTALGAACARRDLNALVQELKEIVPDYTVSDNILARISPLRAESPISPPCAREAQLSEQRQRLWEQSLDHLREALAPVHEQTKPAFDTVRSGL